MTGVLTLADARSSRPDCLSSAGARGTVSSNRSKVATTLDKGEKAGQLQVPCGAATAPASPASELEASPASELEASPVPASLASAAAESAPASVAAFAVVSDDASPAPPSAGPSAAPASGTSAEQGGAGCSGTATQLHQSKAAVWQSMSTAGSQLSPSFTPMAHSAAAAVMSNRVPLGSTMLSIVRTGAPGFTSLLGEQPPPTSSSAKSASGTARGNNRFIRSSFAQWVAKAGGQAPAGAAS